MLSFLFRYFCRYVERVVQSIEQAISRMLLYYLGFRGCWYHCWNQISIKVPDRSDQRRGTWHLSVFKTKVYQPSMFLKIYERYSKLTEKTSSAQGIHSPHEAARHTNTAASTAASLCLRSSYPPRPLRYIFSHSSLWWATPKKLIEKTRHISPFFVLLLHVA